MVLSTTILQYGKKKERKQKKNCTDFAVSTTVGLYLLYPYFLSVKDCMKDSNHWLAKDTGE